NEPENLKQFAGKVETLLRKKNIYYDDLISGNILSPLSIRPVRKHGFIDYMKSIGKLGGQNKVPRLSNDRQVAEVLEKFAEQ
ncbi:MAG: GH3 auxin-responsive promoter family protein, partial [Flavitalea sp.]